MGKLTSLGVISAKIDIPGCILAKNDTPGVIVAKNDTPGVHDLRNAVGLPRDFSRTVSAVIVYPRGGCPEARPVCDVNRRMIAA